MWEGRGRGIINLISWVPFSSLKGTQLINFIITLPPPFPYTYLFTWRRKQKPLPKRYNFTLLNLFHIGRWKKSKFSIILNSVFCSHRILWLWITNCQTLISADRVQYYTSPCTICGSKIGSGCGFRPSVSFYRRLSPCPWSYIKSATGDFVDWNSCISQYNATRVGS
jgi:hypothetical protein